MLKDPFVAGITGGDGERGVIGGIDEFPADDDEHDDDGHLHRHDDRVHGCRFLRTFHQQRSEDKDDKERGQVDHTAHACVRDLHRRMT